MDLHSAVSSSSCLTLFEIAFLRIQVGVSPESDGLRGHCDRIIGTSDSEAGVKYNKSAML